MKKLLIFAVIVGGFATLTACKKDHTCRCTVEVDAGSLGTSTTTADTIYTDKTKKDAEAECTSNNGTASLLGNTITTTCSLL